MPYARQVEFEYMELTRKIIQLATINEFQDLDDLAISLKAIWEDDTTYTHPEKFKDVTNDLKELLQDGFDLYATDEIVNFISKVKTNRGREGGYTDVPAFTTIEEKIYDNEDDEKKRKIEEARSEFTNIVKAYIKNRIDKIASMSHQDKIEFIAAQTDERNRAAANHRIFAEHKAPEPGSEAHVLTQEQAIIQMQQRAMAEMPDQTYNLGGRISLTITSTPSPAAIDVSSLSFRAAKFFRSVEKAIFRDRSSWSVNFNIGDGTYNDDRIADSLAQDIISKRNPPENNATAMGILQEPRVHQVLFVGSLANQKARLTKITQAFADDPNMLRLCTYLRNANHLGDEPIAQPVQRLGGRR